MKTPAPRKGTAKKAKNWRSLYRGRLLNLRFPSMAAMERVRKAARAENDSINGFVASAAIAAADQILKPRAAAGD